MALEDWGGSDPALLTPGSHEASVLHWDGGAPAASCMGSVRWLCVRPTGHSGPCCLHRLECPAAPDSPLSWGWLDLGFEEKPGTQ